MRKFFLFTILSSIFMIPVKAQLNNYKYIIIPKKFEAFKRENMHQTSTLLKHLCIEKGFNAVYEGDYPQDLAANNCLALHMDLKDESSLFTTKTSLVLTDCKEQEIFTSVQGRSKLKDYKEAYGEAIREAFKSLAALSYTYEPINQDIKPLTVSMKNDVKDKELVKEVERTKMQQNKDPLVVQEASPEKQLYKDQKPQASDMKKAQQTAVKNPPAPPSPAASADIWYAQAVPNGYQLVDNTPKIRLKLHNSSQPEIYLAENEHGHGIVYKKGNAWYFEYYKDQKLVVEQLQIKF